MHRLVSVRSKSPPVSLRVGVNGFSRYYNTNNLHSVNSYSTAQPRTRNTSKDEDGPLMLHHEWIIDGKVQTSPPSLSLTSTSTSTSTSTVHRNTRNNDVIVFLHGLLGNNKNLRTPAKKLSQQTGVNALMLDLRGHGLSQLQLQSNTHSGNNNTHNRSHSHHSIHNCANDVIHTLQQLNLTGLSSPKYICGHSFGGRCALAYHHILATSPSTQVKLPQHTWILDSCPGKAHSSVANVIHAVSSIQMPVRSKQQLVQILTQEKHIDHSIASWMTTNLKQVQHQHQHQHHEKGFDFMFDLQVVHSILNDFGNQDMMHQLRECMLHSNYDIDSNSDMNTVSSTSTSTIHKVIASRNDSWSPDILQELNSIQSMQHANAHANLNLVTLDAGHWVHVDALDALLEQMVKEF